jgi:protein SCO1/2
MRRLVMLREDRMERARNRGMPRHRAGSAVVAALLLLLLPAGRLSAADGGGSGVRGPGYRITQVAVSVPDVMLTGMDGRPVPLRAMLGDDRPVMLQFVFTTCPTICPLLTGISATVREGLGKDREKIRAISITIDPEHDTPAVLREYAANFDADPEWLFLTGSLSDVVAVQKAFGSYLGNKMNHPPYTFLRRSPRDSWVRIDGIVHADVIEHEARKLLVAR